MNHTIQNDILAVSVLQKGAEICSIRSVKTGNEYIWDANPAIWAGHSPVLFPIIGCLKDDCYKYKGQIYSLPRHGFIRDNDDIALESITSEKS